MDGTARAVPASGTTPDDMIRDRIAAGLERAGITCVASIRAPGETGQRRWSVTLTDGRVGLDAVAALARLDGVDDVRRVGRSRTFLTFDIDPFAAARRRVLARRP